MTHKLESLETFWKYLEFFETITKMMESDEDIIIDTGIYEHYNDNCDVYCECHDDTPLDTNRDIIKIYCKDGTIILKDIIKAVDKIKKQFEDLQKQRCELPKYYFEEIDYNIDTNTYSIIWNI